MEVLGEGKYLRLVSDGKWEYAERKQASGAIVVAAITAEDRLLLVEQHRAALGKRTIELPAGLVGDDAGSHGEELATAAHRELLEETGYRAGQMDFLTEGPPSAGLANEMIAFFLATNLVQEHEGGGDEHEDITVHEVPLSQVHDWLADRGRAGLIIDPKIYAGLYFCRIMGW